MREWAHGPCQGWVSEGGYILRPDTHRETLRVRVLGPVNYSSMLKAGARSGDGDGVRQRALPEQLVGA